MALVAITTVSGSLFLIPRFGLLGVAYGYLLGAFLWLGGLCFGWVRLFGRRSSITLMRVAGLPLVLGCGLAFAQFEVRSWWGEPGWIVMFVMGGAFALAGATALIVSDLLLGGESPLG